MQSVLKALKHQCAEDVKAREKIGDKTALNKRTDLPLLLLVLFMLVMTLIYMAWSISKIHDMNHSINSIHQEKSEADRKADLFFEAVRKKQKK